VLLFALTTLLAAPVWFTVITSALFVSSTTYLSALVYGVVNDLFATRSNLPYFLLDHQPQQTSLLPTNDPIAQGVAWGVAATFGPAVIASIVFGVATVITASLVPVATFVFPVMLLAMPLIAWGADAYAKRKAKKYAAVGLEEYGDLDNINLGANEYQCEGLTIMNPNKTDKARWLANSDRNMFGFTKVPLIGLGALAAMITLSSVSSMLPIVLFSATLATIMPVAFAGLAVLFLVAAGIYMYVNRNKQIDNRFKLAFDTAPTAAHELYLDEDLEYFNSLNPKITIDIKSDQSKVPAHHPSPLSRTINPTAFPNSLNSYEEEDDPFALDV
jgi:hypothetical protein